MRLIHFQVLAGFGPRFDYWRLLFDFRLPRFKAATIANSRRIGGENRELIRSEIRGRPRFEGDRRWVIPGRDRYWERPRFERDPDWRPRSRDFDRFRDSRRKADCGSKLFVLPFHLFHRHASWLLGLCG